MKWCSVITVSTRGHITLTMKQFLLSLPLPTRYCLFSYFFFLLLVLLISKTVIYFKVLLSFPPSSGCPKDNVLPPLPSCVVAVVGSSPPRSYPRAGCRIQMERRGSSLCTDLFGEGREDGEREAKEKNQVRKTNLPLAIGGRRKEKAG